MVIDTCRWELQNDENLERAVSRHDVVFFHAAMEHKLDHIIQILYAMNDTYIPSRKRNKQHIDTFTKAPSNLWNRLLEIIKLGSDESSLNNGYKKYYQVKEEILELI